jgi:SAM-dependent methyltransferase
VGADPLAGWWSYDRRLVPVLAEPFLPALVEMLPSADGPVLDLGAGTGATARALRRAGHAVVAVDLVPSALAVGRALDPDAARWLAADAGRLPLRDGSVAAVACQQGLQQVPDLAAVLGECRRVTVPAGPLVALFWTGPVAGPFAAINAAAVAAGWYARPPLTRPYDLTADRLRTAATEAGYLDARLAELRRTVPVPDPVDLARHWTEHGIGDEDGPPDAPVREAAAALFAEHLPRDGDGTVEVRLTATLAVLR